MLALARLGTNADAALLTKYLDRYLRRPDCQYDQVWAMGALLSIDHSSNTVEASRFLTVGGLWQQWAHHDSDPDQYRRLITRLSEHIDAVG